MKASKSDHEKAVARLRDWIKPGDTIYTQLKHVSRSGMSRVIQLVKLENNEPHWIGFTVAEAGVGQGYDREREGIKVGGCGMDMGFALVYELSHVCFPEYDCLGDKCPSNAHVNYRGPREQEPRGEGVRHNDGYALKHRWL